MKFAGLVILYFILPGHYGCTNITGDCENEVFERIHNAQKTQTIIKFDRGCGATVGNSVHVSVIASTDSLRNDGGNVFIAEMKGSWDESDTTVVPLWIDCNTMLIKYDKSLTVFKKDSIINEINVV